MPFRNPPVDDQVLPVLYYLLADPTLSAMVGNHIYSEEFADSALDSMPMRAILLSEGGHPSRYGYAHLDDMRVVTKSYGSTVAEAKLVGNHLHHRLQYGGRERHLGFTILSSRHESGGMVLQEPQTSWPYWVRTYLVHMATSI